MDCKVQVKAQEKYGKGADCKEKVKQKKSAGNCKIYVKRQRSFGKEDFYENGVKRQENSGKAELCEDGVKQQQAASGGKLRQTSTRQVASEGKRQEAPEGKTTTADGRPSGQSSEGRKQHPARQSAENRTRAP